MPHSKAWPSPSERLSPSQRYCRRLLAPPHRRPRTAICGGRPHCCSCAASEGATAHHISLHAMPPPMAAPQRTCMCCKHGPFACQEGAIFTVQLNMCLPNLECVAAMFPYLDVYRHHVAGHACGTFHYHDSHAPQLRVTLVRVLF